jgi:hypothetical protein
VLEFPCVFFDLVNLRFGFSFMRKWDGPKMFSEMHRVLQPHGIARIVEGEVTIESSSAALTTFYTYFRRAMVQTGHLFNEEPTRLIDYQPELLRRHNFLDIQPYKIPFEYSTSTEVGQALLADLTHFYSAMAACHQSMRHYVSSLTLLPDQQAIFSVQPIISRDKRDR